jgi:sulfur carrier protein ThiS
MTVEQEIAQDAPLEKMGTLADIIDQNKIEQGAVALTVTGRPYHRAAAELKMMTDRKGVVLNEYTVLNKSTAAALEELYRVHTRIDQIIDELSRS